MATPTETIGDRIRPSLLTVEDAVTIDVSGRTDAAVLVPLGAGSGALDEDPGDGLRWDAEDGAGLGTEWKSGSDDLHSSEHRPGD